MKTIIILFLSSCIISSCKNENHIDRYNINLDSLKTLADNFYGYQRGRIYLTNENYRIWLTLEKESVHSVYKIDNLKNNDNSLIATIKSYTIDTFLTKNQAQRFIELSKMYKFGHINIDHQNKISISWNEDVSEQYIYPLNKQIKQEYLGKKYFRLLKNGWFEYID